MEIPEYPLLTPSLLMRPYQEADFEPFAEIVGDPEVTRYLLWGPRDRASAREAFDKRLQPFVPGGGQPHLQLALFARAGGAFVGEMALMHLDNPHRGAEIGYILAPAFHGRGLAVEAGRAILDVGFDCLGLHRVTGTCDERNAASARVMEKLGMRREAHHLSSHFYKGEWVGGFVYAILEGEWRAQSAQSRSGSRK